MTKFEKTGDIQEGMLTADQEAAWREVLDKLDDGACRTDGHVEECGCRANLEGCYRIDSTTGGETAQEGVANRNVWRDKFGVEPFYSDNGWWVAAPEYLRRQLISE